MPHGGGGAPLVPGALVAAIILSVAFVNTPFTSLPILPTATITTTDINAPSSAYSSIEAPRSEVDFLKRYNGFIAAIPCFYLLYDFH